MSDSSTNPPAREYAAGGISLTDIQAEVAKIKSDEDFSGGEETPTLEMETRHFELGPTGLVDKNPKNQPQWVEGDLKVFYVCHCGEEFITDYENPRHLCECGTLYIAHYTLEVVSKKGD